MVAPRDSSSLLLLRDGPASGGLEVLMVRRHSKSVFAGGMHVFPGGELDESDSSPEWEELCRGPNPDEIARITADGTPSPKALGLQVAGVRELFEETGILLAYEKSGELVSYEGEKGDLFRNYCTRIREGAFTFQDMVRECDLRIALDRLVFFAHWITPEISPIRYDTRFFLAPAPSRQEPRHDRVEITTCLWISPREAMRLSGKGDFPLLPPTMANLAALVEFNSVVEALEAAQGRDVPPVLLRFRS